jgi:hypothetical protein
MAAAQSAAAAAAPAPIPAPQKSTTAEVIPAAVAPPAEAQPGPVELPAVINETTESSSPDFVLSAGLEPQQSWLVANIYVFIVVLLVAAAVVATILLH